MKNLFCVFFGHIDNKKLVEPDTLKIQFYKTTLANIKQCKRCNSCYFESTTSRGNCSVDKK